MAIKKSQLYTKLWQACDELRGGMDASQYKDYVLVVLFIKYISDRAKNGDADLYIDLPQGCAFDDLVSLKGKPDIGERMNVRTSSWPIRSRMRTSPTSRSWARARISWRRSQT